MSQHACPALYNRGERLGTALAGSLNAHGQRPANATPRAAPAQIRPGSLQVPAADFHLRLRRPEFGSAICGREVALFPG